MITLRQAINAFCLHCQGDDPWKVGNCTKAECHLHSVRPNQQLEGQQAADYDPAEMRQELLDALSYQGLKELSNVRSGYPRPDRKRTRASNSLHPR